MNIDAIERLVKAHAVFAQSVLAIVSSSDKSRYVTTSNQDKALEDLASAISAELQP